MSYREGYKGTRLTVLYSTQVDEFLDDRRTPVEARARLTRIWGNLDANPLYRNKEKFESEGNGLFAAKAFKVRLYGWFTDDNRFICGIGEMKKRDKADPVTLKRVAILRQNFK